jgi:hypothetical protein
MVEENKIQTCKITLTTSADGKETQIVRTGSVFLSLSKSIVRYSDENAEFTLIFEKDSVKLERRGDYGLSLLLKQGEYSDGMLGFGGSNGNIRVYAHKINYSTGKDSLLASLHYDLIFGEERQEMKLRLYVKRA